MLHKQKKKKRSLVIWNNLLPKEMSSQDKKEIFDHIIVLSNGFVILLKIGIYLFTLLCLKRTLNLSSVL